jgi:hypothetical protein
MVGLDPAILFVAAAPLVGEGRAQQEDGRVKPGHDGFGADHDGFGAGHDGVGVTA